jgi:membrane protease YdiL (CAAX protease family)
VFEGLYAVLFAATAGVCLAAVLGLLIALLWASTYSEERETVSERFQSALGYTKNATRWGLAGAGVGALLTTTLPARFVTTTASPNQVPTAAWVAIFLGGVGIAVGILEERHARPDTADPDAPPH